MSNTDLDKFLSECPTHKKLPWKIGAMESGQVAIDSDDGKEVTGWIDPEDAYLILNQQQRIEELERELANMTSDRDSWNEQADERTKDAVMFIQERDALQADNARLREALERMRVAGGSQEFHMAWELAQQALAATPEQSLARIRNQIREKCAALCNDESLLDYDPVQTLENCAKAISDMKEPE